MESNIPAYNEIKSQADAVLYFFQRMDIEMIDTLLENDRKYQDFEKNIFIEKLGIALDEFRKAGDTSLNRYKGHCNSKTCNYKSSGFRFIGNNSGNYFDLIVEIKDGIVQDICQCFKFKNSVPLISKSDLIEIDPQDPF